VYRASPFQNSIGLIRLIALYLSCSGQKSSEQRNEAKGGSGLARGGRDSPRCGGNLAPHKGCEARRGGWLARGGDRWGWFMQKRMKVDAGNFFLCNSNYQLERLCQYSQNLPCIHMCFCWIWIKLRYFWDWNAIYGLENTAAWLRDPVSS